MSQYDPQPALTPGVGRMRALRTHAPGTGRVVAGHAARPATSGGSRPRLGRRKPAFRPRNHSLDLTNCSKHAIIGRTHNWVPSTPFPGAWSTPGERPWSCSPQRLSGSSHGYQPRLKSVCSRPDGSSVRFEGLCEIFTRHSHGLGRDSRCTSSVSGSEQWILQNSKREP